MYQFNYPPFSPCQNHRSYDADKIFYGGEKGPEMLGEVVSCEGCIFPCEECKELLLEYIRKEGVGQVPYCRTKKKRKNSGKELQCQSCANDSSKKSCSSTDAGLNCSLCEKNGYRCELFDFTDSAKFHLHLSDGTNVKQPKAVQRGKKRKDPEEGRDDIFSESLPMGGVATSAQSLPHLFEAYEWQEAGSSSEVASAGGLHEANGTSTTSIFSSTQQDSTNMVNPVLAQLWFDLDHYDQSSTQYCDQGTNLPHDQLSRSHEDHSSPNRFPSNTAETQSNLTGSVEMVEDIPVPRQICHDSVVEWISIINMKFCGDLIKNIMNGYTRTFYTLRDLEKIFRKVFQSIIFLKRDAILKKRKDTDEYKALDRSAHLTKSMMDNIISFSQLSNTPTARDADSSRLIDLLDKKSHILSEVQEANLEILAEQRQKGTLDEESPDAFGRISSVRVILFLFCLAHLKILEVED